MSSGTRPEDEAPQEPAPDVPADDEHPEADAIDVAVGPDDRPWQPLPSDDDQPRFAPVEGDEDEEPVPQENFPPIVYTISDAADVDITQPTSNLVTIEAAVKKAEDGKSGQLASTPAPDPEALDRQAAERQAAEAQLASMLAASTQPSHDAAPAPAQSGPRPQFVKMRAESGEVAERVKRAKQPRPAYMQPPGTIPQKHKSVYGLVRHDRPEEHEPPRGEGSA